MHHSHRNWIAALVFATVAVGVLSTASAQSARRGPPIQFSDAKNDMLTTNVSILTDQSQNSVKRLGQDIERPIQPLKSDAGIGGNLGMPYPPAGPIIQSKKIRELVDQQKNWAFGKPEDHMKGLTDEEIMRLPQLDAEGKDQAEKTAIERYYEDLTRRDLGTTNRVSEGMTDSGERSEVLGSEPESSDPEVKAVRAGLGETEQNLRVLVDQNTSSKGLLDLGSTRTMPSLFDTKSDNKSDNSWQTRGQESRLEQFKQSLQVELPKPTSPTFSGFSAGGATLGATFPAAAGLTGSRLTPSPAPRASVTTPAADSFTSGGLSASPSLSGVRPMTPPAQPTVRQQPALFRDIPKPRF